ncbi:MAG: serine/threonine protein kinase [Thermomicrobiales bacterium]|nr:serine/threonine protein kinase [Thermomicrobiales bacterium]
MFQPGATVNGRYRVDHPIGEGGMAVVYVGHDLLLGRDIAIKALRPQYAADPAFRVRFRREAQSAAGFSHPNIIDIYDVGEEAGIPYFVMAYVPGHTLKQIIDAEAPFHPDDVAGLLQQVCAALDYAHQRGYVHRDVKPHNILVDTSGHALVADFGIAKGAADADLTDVGEGLGTVHYLSPEQAQGLMATPASDVYAVGVVAFEMLTRTLPFDAETSVAVAMRQIHDPPPAPSSVLPSIPPAVDAIVLRALAKDPTRRFPSAGAFARDMTYWRHYRPPVLRTSADTGRTAPLSSPAGEGTRALPVGKSGRVESSVGTPTRSGARAGGCVTWLVAAAILVGLIGLLIVGVRLSQRLGDTDNETPAPTAGPVAPVVVETHAPAIVTIAPRETPTPISVVVPTTEPVEIAPPPQVAPTIAPIVPAANDNLVRVPDLFGRNLDEARDLLATQGLKMVQGAPVANSGYPAGAIVDQNPAPGDTLLRGAPVMVRVSSGSASANPGASGVVRR